MALLALGLYLYLVKLVPIGEPRGSAPLGPCVPSRAPSLHFDIIPDTSTRSTRLNLSSSVSSQPESRSDDGETCYSVTIRSGSVNVPMVTKSF